MNTFEQIIKVYEENRFDGTPGKTVAGLVEAIGEDAARIMIAELVNTVGSWDGRIDSRNRAWANAQTDARTRDELMERYIYQPSDIHPAHIDQLGYEARKRWA